GLAFIFYVFFFQAEDGIRDFHVTGVQTCALPISGRNELWADVEVFEFEGDVYRSALLPAAPERVLAQLEAVSEFVEKIFIYQYRSEERRVGKEGRSRRVANS